MPSTVPSGGAKSRPPGKVGAYLISFRRCTSVVSGIQEVEKRSRNLPGRAVVDTVATSEPNVSTAPSLHRRSFSQFQLVPIEGHSAVTR